MLRMSAPAAVLAAFLLSSATASAATTGSVFTPPAAPTGLTASPGDGSVTLDWNDSSDLVSGDRYQVYVNDKLVADGPTASTYKVTGLTNGTTYSFRVSAGGSSLRLGPRYGPWSNAVNAKPQGAPTTPPVPAAPTGLTATPGDGSVTLDWNDSNDLVAGDRYQVYVNGAMVADGPTASTYKVTGLTNGTQYAFRVSAGGSSTRPASQRYGPWSDAITAAPQGSSPPPPPPPSTVFPKSYLYNQISSSPTVSSSSSSWVDSVVSGGKPEALYLNDWQWPQYTASSSDPSYTVSVTHYVGPQGDHTVRIPAGALPAPGGDASMAITDPSSNEYWGFYGVQSIDRNAHTITASGGGVVPLDGDGSLYGESSLHEATKLGVVTPEELNAGHIDHALMVTVTCTTGAVNGAGTTRDCASMGKPSGPPNGAHLQLQIRDSELAQFPAWKQTILRAMRDYGMYVSETGGGFLKADYAPGTALATKWQNWLNAHSSDPGIDASGRTLDFTGGVDWRNRLRVVSP